MNRKRTCPSEPNLSRLERDRQRRDGCITDADVVALWQQLERHRRGMTDAHALFQTWLDKSSELAEAWHAFLTAGGTSGTDFTAFAQGRFRPHQVRQRKHLRLVAVRHAPRIRRRPIVSVRPKRGNDGPEAA